jgi:predicted metal-dependent phosphoesterase TrpH
MKVDFHLHTRLSDGALEPSELLAAVRREGVDAWAVTDHDSFAAWRELRGEPGLVPGVEVSASSDGREVHVVGLGVDPEHAELNALLGRIRRLRRERLAAIIARLPASAARGVGMSDLEDGRAESLSRNHLARALVRRRGARTMQEAFALHLGDEHVRDPSLPCFPPLDECCAAIRAAGGLAILAHPAVHRTREAVAKLIDAGCDGLELASPNLEGTLAAELAELADARSLYASAGSDLHTLGYRRPGMHQLPDERLAPLTRRLRIAA